MTKRLDVAVERRVMDLLATGIGPMEVSRRTGVSKSKVYVMHHRVGGVYRPADAKYCDRYLNREDRYEIARLKDAGHSMRSIGEMLGRSPATISRELDRNRNEATGRYEPERADRLAWERQRRPKPSKLSQHPELRQEVQAGLNKRWSPDQIAGRLEVDHPDDPDMRISGETIYMSLYVYPRGEHRRELSGQLRRGRRTRKRRGRKENRGGIPNPTPIKERPAAVEDRIEPGHHEGDLIMGSKASNSAVGTIVERVTGMVTLLHLPDGFGAHQVSDAVIEEMGELPSWFVKTLTWDRGIEMCQHAKITEAIDLLCFFADPYSPWQRGSNENTNGLLREYLPKGTDLSVHTRQDLQAVADALNNRPRKRLGYLTPREAYDRLTSDQATEFDLVLRRSPEFAPAKPPQPPVADLTEHPPPHPCGRSAGLTPAEPPQAASAHRARPHRGCAEPGRPRLRTRGSRTQG
jgi:IS30 family transposase